MQLNRITVKVRPRTLWEGADLGFALARHWFFPLWIIWWVTALPVALISYAALHNYPSYITVAIWWCKPLYEPPLLYWLSRALFDEKPRVLDVFKDWRHSVWPNLIPNLLWLRLSPSRSFLMPVSILERLRGTQRNDRVRVLKGAKSIGGWVTIVCVHFEMIIYFSFIALAVILIPEELYWLDLEDLFDDQNPTVLWFNLIFYVLTISLIAPFYVAAGFGLYVTRRTELEAWDVELAFRRLQQRLESLPRNVRTITSSVVLVTLGLFAAIDSDAATNLSHTQAKVLIEEILDDDAFGEPKTIVRWRLKDPNIKPNEDKLGIEWLDNLSGWLSGIVGWLVGVHLLAAIFKAALWIGAAALIVLIAWLIWRQARWFESRGGKIETQRDKAVPAELFGLDLSDEDLSGDVSSRINQHLQDAKKREAVSLLYRATLHRLLHEYGLGITTSNTERECIGIIRRKRPARESEFLSRLVDCWLRLAYGHQTPATEAIASLNQEWQQIFTHQRSPASD